MTLVEQSLWWLVPFVVLMALMVHAMMEFTVSLLRQPGIRRRPLPADELRRRLLALELPAPAYQLVEGRDCDLEVVWGEEEIGPPGRLTRFRSGSQHHLRFLLDEQRHELRMNQVSQSYYYFIGLAGWLPRLGGGASIHAGPPGTFLTESICQVAIRGGWRVRPVIWAFQATASGFQRLTRLTPGLVRRWSARRFWGMVYPLSYALGIGYLVAIAGPLDRSDWWIILGVSAGWWGVWGFLVWMISGFPAFWRRPGR